MADRDFFISFNSADEAYAKAISDSLRAAGFTTFFHPDDLEYGGYIPKWMDDALKNARQMLALCSPAYMDNGAIYSEAERYAAFWRDTRGQEFKIIPVVLQDVQFPPLMAPYKRLNVTNLTPEQAAAAVVAVVRRPDQTKERQLIEDVRPLVSARSSDFADTRRLPETGYQRLVGRDEELRRLDEAWLNTRVNIVSLIAEGGAGKSALVNGWLRRLQDAGYPGADLVLGWSFYSQGTERAASAEEFLNWALARMGVKLDTPSATAKADAIAEAMIKRRVLLVLDGVEPLQHGPGPQIGNLKDLGLRALLRRFAETPPGALHGLIVLTSRLVIKDIARWQDGPAIVRDVEQLSDEAGAALLRDNGVKGSDKELKATAREFDGHPLALGLLASFLTETQDGDVRRRDHIRGLLTDMENPGHDHAARVMESYEREWLADRPVEHAIMRMLGLFDRPANRRILFALRRRPVIGGVLESIVDLDDMKWRRAIARLRDARLLVTNGDAALNEIDAHPLVREWFGEGLKRTNEASWKAAHGRLYEYLRDTTKEGRRPTLEDLAPLYQAISHACKAGRQEEALRMIYQDRLCRRRPDGNLEHYSANILGALGADLAAISWFFDQPYDQPATALSKTKQAWVLAEAAFLLDAQGRLREALLAQRAAVREATESRNIAIRLVNLSRSELLAGEIASAVATAARSVQVADRQAYRDWGVISRAAHASALHAAGRAADARSLFADAEKRQREVQPQFPLLYALQGRLYCDLLLGDSEFSQARDHALRTLEFAGKVYLPLDRAMDALTMGSAHLGLALESRRDQTCLARAAIDEAINGCRALGALEFVARSLLAHVAFLRCIGEWNGATRDLNEAEEIAEPGPMKLYLCDIALERARLAFAQIEAFAPLNGMLEKDNLAPPKQLSNEQKAKLKADAEEQVEKAGKLIEECGYHRRDEELAELKDVLVGKRTFASLPPRV